MVEPKTDWEPTDFFNLADYTRITGNLAEAFTLSGFSPPSFRALTVGAVLQQDDRRQIATAYNRLAMVYGKESVSAERTHWFDAAELNRLESLCAQAEAAYGQGQRYGSGKSFGAGETLGGGEFG